MKVKFHYNAMFLMKKNYISNKAKTYGFIWNFDKKNTIGLN